MTRVCRAAGHFLCREERQVPIAFWGFLVYTYYPMGC